MLDFNWINILILFGAVQGLIFGIILLFNKKHPGAKFLSVFMLALAYNGFETFNWSSGLETVYLRLYPFVLIYTIGPSLYFYVTSLLYPERRLPPKTIFLHYAFVGFQFAFRSVEIVYLILWINNIYRGPFSVEQLDQIYWFYSEPLSVLVFLGYLLATIFEFRKVKASGSIPSFSKENRDLVFKWVPMLLGCMIILGIAWPLTVVSFYLGYSDEAYYPVELCLVLFIYWIAFVGYHKTKQIYVKESKSKASSALSAADAEKYFAQLKNVVERDKLFLDAELNLNKLSSATGINAKVISAILNQYHKSNFNDFINQYRVEDVKEKLINPGYQHLTISAIALESGFNSQATFQRAFKHYTGMSPKEYMSVRIRSMA